MQTKTVGVLYGGFSSERSVSIRSGNHVALALKELGHKVVMIDPAVQDLASVKVDVIFNCLHGYYGEDGGIQAEMEMLGIPYTGPRVTASVIGMNKHLSKQIFRRNGLPTLDSKVVTADVSVDIPFPLPWVVKPINDGSSVGVTIIDSQSQYTNFVPQLLHRFPALLVEPYIEGREITIGVIEPQGKPEALPILELKASNRFYDYEAKYTSGKTEFIVPARLDKKLTQYCQELAVKVHQVTGCVGVSRTDFIIDKHNQPWILEVNTLPGMTELSDVPAEATAAGYSFAQLVHHILERAH